MLCKPNMDLFETLTCFEVQDKKMDCRMHRATALNPKKASEDGVFVPAQDLSED